MPASATDRNACWRLIAGGLSLLLLGRWHRRDYEFLTVRSRGARQAQEAQLKQLVITCLQVDIDPEQIFDETNLWTLGANSVFYVKLQRRLKAELEPEEWGGRDPKAVR